MGAEKQASAVSLRVVDQDAGVNYARRQLRGIRHVARPPPDRIAAMVYPSKANRILRIFRLYAEDRGLRPSRTVYKKWGKGEKTRLRFSKSDNLAIEELYSTHYLAGSEVNGG